MLRRFLRDSAIYALAALFSRGIGIILVPIYTRFLTAAEVGALDLLTMAATLANYMVALEISQGVARFYADAKDASERERYVSSAWWFAGCAYTAFFLVAFPFSREIAATLLGSGEWESAVRAMCAAFTLNGMFFLTQDLVRWQLRPLQFALTSLGYTAVGTGVGLFLLLKWDAGVPGLLYGQCAGAVLGMLLGWLGDAWRYWRLDFDATRWRAMLRYSAPQAFSAVAAYATLYADRLVINRFLTLEDVGTYGIAARIASVVALLMVGFQSALVPIVFQQYRVPETRVQLARTFHYFLAAAAAFVLFLCACSKELLWIFTTTAYFGSWSAIPLLASAILLANMSIFAPGLFLERRTPTVAVINLMACALALVASTLLVPLFGLIGAAIATLQANAVLFAAYVYCNQRYYPLALRARNIALAFAIALSAAVVLMGLQRAIEPGEFLAARFAIWIVASLVCGRVLVGSAEFRLAAERVVGIIRLNR